MRELFAIRELGVGTSGVWRQLFGFGPDARTSHSSFFKASPVATEGKAGYYMPEREFFTDNLLVRSESTLSSR